MRDKGAGHTTRAALTFASTSVPVAKHSPLTLNLVTTMAWTTCTVPELQNDGMFCVVYSGSYCLRDFSQPDRQTARSVGHPPSHSAEIPWAYASRS